MIAAASRLEVAALITAMLPMPSPEIWLAEKPRLLPEVGWRLPSIWKDWMLPNEDRSENLQPFLVLKTADREFVFQGRRQRRPDVAEAYGRPDAENAGFVFVVRRTEIPPTELRVSLEYRTAKGGVFTNTDHRVANQEIYEEATLANVHPSLTKPARQIFLGVLP